MFDRKGVEYRVLHCYPPYGAVEIDTELRLSEQILTRNPLAEITVGGEDVAGVGVERLIPRDNFPVFEGQELVLNGKHVVICDIMEGSGVVTALTHIKVMNLENARICVMSPAPGTGFVDIPASQRFESIRVLIETVTRLRQGRRLVVRTGAPISLGGLPLHIGYADPSPSLLTSDSSVQILSSLHDYLPPAPPRIPHHISSFSSHEFHSPADITCTICQTQLEQGNKVVTLPCGTLYAGHLHHTDCINPWLKSNRTCPVCKASVD